MMKVHLFSTHSIWNVAGWPLTYPEQGGESGSSLRNRACDQPDLDVLHGLRTVFFTPRRKPQALYSSFRHAAHKLWLIGF